MWSWNFHPNKRDILLKSNLGNHYTFIYSTSLSGLWKHLSESLRKQQKQQLGKSFPNDWVSMKENCQELTIIKLVAHSRN